MTDPIEKLAEIYATLENGQKPIAREIKTSILEMQATIADLESSIARQPLPEAPASLNVKVVDPTTQLEYQVTIREARAGLALIGHIPEISAALTGLGLVAVDAYIDGRRAERGNGKELHAPGVVTLDPVQPADAFTFNAETLEKSTNGDKTYYKVKGGRFSKFGVTVWPEVLSVAGFDLDTLTGVTSLNGYTAYYILNEKGDPGKVVGLKQA